MESTTGVFTPIIVKKSSKNYKLNMRKSNSNSNNSMYDIQRKSHALKNQDNFQHVKFHLN
jgi:hypothetical protein